MAGISSDMIDTTFDINWKMSSKSDDRAKLGEYIQIALKEQIIGLSTAARLGEIDDHKDAILYLERMEKKASQRAQASKQNDIQMNLIQCDAKVQQIIKIKDKKELEKMKIRGLGGTILQPALDFITDKKNKIYMYNTVILTDGYTDALNFKMIKTKTLILSKCEKCPISFDNNRVKQINNIGKQD